MSDLYKTFSPLLFRMDAEQAHNATLKLLKTGLAPRIAPVTDPALAVTLWNRKFPNPVGLAAGFDKNAEVIGPMFGFGFGFVEAGTVTPKPQDGNPKPRVFRDIDNEAVINRMGFPNGGLVQFKENLQKFAGRKPRPTGIIGLNIGMNKTQTEPAKDYRLLVQHLAPLADYMVINISSPNTPGLRDLQKREPLLDLIGQVIEERGKACKIDPPPLLVKLAPDLDEAQQEEIAGAVMEAGIDGLILTNTTLERPSYLDKDFATQQGGLSGAPVGDKSTEVLRNFYRLTGGKLPLIGLGGVSCAADAYEKIKAGASLVQLYTALVFRGPGVVKEINSGLLQLLKKDGYNHITEAVGTDSGHAEAGKAVQNI